MLSKTILIGNLGKDPEVKAFESGTSCTRFSLATSERFKDKSGDQKTVTEWHNITAWGKLGEICAKYLKKGSKVYIEGTIKSRKYEVQGVERTAIEIVAKEMSMLDSKQESALVRKAEPVLPAATPFDDEIPF